MTTEFVAGNGVAIDPHATACERMGAYVEKANDVQVDGDHYKCLGIQPWDAIRDWNLGFFDGNVVKYIARFRRKGGLVDLHKARHYLQKLIEDEENKL
jgi:hypothetical protein